jgi:hypothetical protein
LISLLVCFLSEYLYNPYEKRATNNKKITHAKNVSIGLTIGILKKGSARKFLIGEEWKFYAQK